MDQTRINAFLLWNAFQEAMCYEVSVSDFDSSIMNTIINDKKCKYRLGEENILDAIYLWYEFIEHMEEW